MKMVDVTWKENTLYISVDDEILAVLPPEFVPEIFARVWNSMNDEQKNQTYLYIKVR